MIKKDDVLVDGSDWLVSLVKLTGKKIIDIEMYPSKKFGGISLKVCYITFDDGNKIFVEGEHDFPYLTDSYKCPVLPDEESLEELYKQLNDDEEE